MEGGGAKIFLQCHGGGAIFFPCILEGGGGRYFWPIDFAKPPPPLRPQIMNAPYATFAFLPINMGGA